MRKVILAERMHWTLDYIDSLNIEDYQRVQAVLEGIDRARAPGKDLEVSGGQTGGIRRTTVIG